jgi:hypothetical protein
MALPERRHTHEVKPEQSNVLGPLPPATYWA